MTAESARPQTKDLASNDVPSIGEPRLRKRGRNESDTGDTAPPPSGLSGGSRSPNAKRAKAQASAEGTDAIPQAAGLSSSENFYPNLGPSDLAGHSEPIDSQYGPENDGHVSVEGSNDPFSQGLGLRTQSLPVLDNFVSQMILDPMTLLTVSGDPNSEHHCQIISSRSFKHDGCTPDRRWTAMVSTSYAVHGNEKGLR